MITDTIYQLHWKKHNLTAEISDVKHFLAMIICGDFDNSYTHEKNGSCECFLTVF